MCTYYSLILPIKNNLDCLKIPTLKRVLISCNFLQPYISRPTTDKSHLTHKWVYCPKTSFSQNYPNFSQSLANKGIQEKTLTAVQKLHLTFRLINMSLKEK